MKLDVSLPQTDIGGDPDTTKYFDQFAEDIEFSHLAVYGHVVGVNTASRSGWEDAYASQGLFHDPFVPFGFLAIVTTSIELTMQVLILS